MPRFLIERKIPNVGQMTSQQLHDVSAASIDVLHGMQRGGTPIKWVESYVTNDALNCVYVAPNVESVREHARLGGFPCDNVTKVETIIGPTTGE